MPSQRLRDPKPWMVLGCQAAGRKFEAILMCGLGVPVGCRMKNAKGLERLERLRAGKRQAWTPIRSHGCVALGCLLAAG